MSGAAPRWIAVRRSRSRAVTGPGVPSPISKDPPSYLTEPTGVITAAVPQANTSVRAPDATSFSHSSVEMRRSVTVAPSSRASSSSERRVMPGSSDPESSGVTTSWWPSPSVKTKNRFIPPISSTQRCSSASSHTTWSQPCAEAWAWAASDAA